MVRTTSARGEVQRPGVTKQGPRRPERQTREL